MLEGGFPPEDPKISFSHRNFLICPIPTTPLRIFLSSLAERIFVVHKVNRIISHAISTPTTQVIADVL